MRCQDVGGARISAIATPTGTNFNDTGLAPTTSYSYRVKAVDAAGNVGAASTTATASTLADTTQIGRGAGRERGEIPGGAGSMKKKKRGNGGAGGDGKRAR